MGSIIIDTTNTIPGTSDNDLLYFTRGGVNVDTGLDLSALATGLAAVHVSREWRGNIGSASTSLKADVDSGAGLFRYNAGGGACWFSPSGGSAVATLVRNVGRGTLILNGTGTVTTLESGNGQTIIGGNIAATTIRIAGGSVDLQGTSGTAPTTVEITGGTFKTARGTAGGGSMTIWGGAVTIEALTNTLVTLTMSGGSLFLTQSGTITTMNLVAGNAANVHIARPITITTLNIWGSVENASSLTDNPLLTISSTNWRIDTGRNY